MNWTRDRERQQRRELASEARQQRTSAGWTDVDRREQARAERIAREHAAVNSFCASVVNHIDQGKRVTPKQAAALLKIAGEQRARARGARTANRERTPESERTAA